MDCIIIYWTWVLTFSDSHIQHFKFTSHIHNMEDNQLLPSVLVFSTVSFLSWLRIYHEKRRADRQNRCPVKMSCPEKCHVYLGHATMFSGNKIDTCKHLLIDNADSDGISSFYLFHNLCVGLYRPEHMKELLQQCTHRIVDEKIDRHLQKLLGEKSLLLQVGDEWKSNRHIIAKSFRWDYLQAMVPTMNSVATTLTNFLLTNEGKEIDTLPIMKCATLDMIGMTAFGYHFHSIDSLAEPTKYPLQVQLQDAFVYMGEEYKRRQFESPFDPFAFHYNIPTPANIKYRNAKTLWLETLQEIIKARRIDVSNGITEHNDMLGTLLDAHDDETNQKMDELTLVDSLITLLFAGFDTSSIALTYLVYHLAKYPEVDARCAQEIRDVIGDDDLPSYQDLMNKFPYCTAVVQETLRLFPPAPMTSRGLKAPLVLSSANPDAPPITIPAGCRIVVPVWWVNRDPKSYPDAEQFNPERFLPENIESIPRYGYIPFSAGARDCVGRRFALLELVCMTVLVVRKVKFGLSDPSYVAKPITIGVVQVPQGGMPLRISKRE